LIIGFITGVEEFNMKLLLCVMGVGVGVSIASLGEMEFVMVGFLIAVVGLVTEAARLVLTQKLLQGQDIKFNAITGNYYTVCQKTHSHKHV
jgi:drug/metabolite transporter (DMT)-like permease